MQRQKEIEQLIRRDLPVTHLEVINESHMHSVPPNSETHFKVILVSEGFEGLRKVARHQKIYALLGPLMEQGLHALALHTFTPEEWQSQHAVPASPNCMGGSQQQGR